MIPKSLKLFGASVSPPTSASSNSSFGGWTFAGSGAGDEETDGGTASLMTCFAFFFLASRPFGLSSSVFQIGRAHV